MRKIIIIVSVPLLLVVFGFAAHAENTDSPAPTPLVSPSTNFIQSTGRIHERTTEPSTVLGRPEGLNGTIQPLQHSAEAPLTYRFTEMSEFGKEIASAKEKGLETMQTLKDKWQEERTQFLKNVETIKDEKKKEIVKRIDDTINTVNSNQTSYMQKALDQMQIIMSRIIAATQNAKAQGKDTIKVEADIKVAQTAMVAAQTALTTQEAKTYSPVITTDSALHNNVGNTLQSIRTDLDAIHKLVLQVRTALIQAAQDLRAILDVEPTHEVTPTSSATQSALPVETPVATASPTTP